MTLTQMRYYSTVCRTMNVTKASSELHISQPTLSAAIRSLEVECGIELFKHKANSLTITDEGLVLLEEITPLLERYDHLNKIVENRKLNRNFVRLSFSTIACSEICPAICRHYRELYPEIQIITSEANTEMNYENLNKGNVDLILTSKSHSMSAEDWETQYDHIRIPNPPGLVFCCSISHPYAQKNFVTWDEISKVPLIFLDKPFTVGKGMEATMLSAGFEPAYPIQYTSQLYTVERFIENNAACGFLPNSTVINNPKIKSIETPYYRPGEVYLTWIKGKPQFNSVKLFIRTVRNMYK